MTCDIESNAYIRLQTTTTTTFLSYYLTNTNYFLPTGTQSYASTTTTVAFPNQSNGAPGTVVVYLPESEVTSTSYITSGTASTTTVATASGTQVGLVSVFIPQITSYSTSFLNLGASQYSTTSGTVSAIPASGTNSATPPIVYIDVGLVGSAVYATTYVDGRNGAQETTVFSTASASGTNLPTIYVSVTLTDIVTTVTQTLTNSGATAYQSTVTLSASGGPNSGPDTISINEFLVLPSTTTTMYGPPGVTRTTTTATITSGTGLPTDLIIVIIPETIVSDVFLDDKTR